MRSTSEGIATTKEGERRLLSVHSSKFAAGLNIREPSSMTWWLQASWLSSAVSLPCSCFLRFGLSAEDYAACVQSLTKNLRFSISWENFADKADAQRVYSGRTEGVTLT